MGVFGGTFFGYGAVFGVFGLFPLLPFFREKRERIWAIAIFLSFFLGILRIEITPRSNTHFEPLYEKNIEIRGILRDFPDRRRGYENWTLTTDKGKILLKISQKNNLDIGENITVQGILEKPFETEEFSYFNFLAREEIFATMSFPKIKKMEEKSFFPILTPLWRLRTFFENILLTRIPGEEGAFANGILIGERSGFSAETEQKFRKVGLTHLLALSGFNITIVALAVLGVFFWLPQRFRMIATVFSIAIFVLFVGGGASVVRAATMGSIGLFAVHSGRRYMAFLSLVYASVIMVLISPLILAFDPGFQLSIIGTAGILTFGEYFKKLLLRISPLFFAEIMATTLAAQVAVAPLIGLLFGQISLVAPIANLVVSPIIPFAMLFGFLASISGEFLGNIFAFFTWNALHFGILVVNFFAQWEWASVDFVLSQGVFWILNGGIFGAGFWVLQKEKRLSSSVKNEF